MPALPRLALAPTLCFGLALAGRVAAQATFVIPGEYEAKDGPALAEVAGLNQAGRQQVLVRSDELRPLRGRHLVALWLRRDVQFPMPLRGGKAQLAITLSDRARHPAEVSATFADNPGPQPVEVFRGVLDVPTAPQPTPQKCPPWASPTAVEIVFAAPFAYRDGNLCLEIEGRPVAGQQAPMWMVDHALSTADGTTTMVGRGCDPRLHAMAVWTMLAPGSRATMFASGLTQTTGVCLIGQPRQEPLDLAPQGAPSCLVHVDPFEVRPFLFPRQKFELITRVEHPLPLPTMSTFLSAQVAIQWVHIPYATNRAHLATTHMQVLRVANAVPSFPGATVRAGPASATAFPDRGDIQPQSMPVLRFVVR